MDIVYRKRKLVSDVRRPRTETASVPQHHGVPQRPTATPFVAVAGVVDGIRNSARGEKTGAHAQPKQKLPLSTRIRKSVRRSELLYRRVRRVLIALIPRMTPHKAFYFSLVGGVAFGVFSTALMFRFLDSDVRANEQPNTSALPAETVTVPSAQDENVEIVADTSYDADADIFLEYFNEAAQEEYEAEVRDLVKGYPIEAMLPYIFEKDRVIAAFLIGIGKKESNWGKRVPVLDGQDCFNYWGYRGVRRMMGTGGHTCFNSRKDAVDTVARRIEKLVYSEKLNTPEKMILWKCGFSCAGHSRESVKKWISDVDMYFRDLNYE